MTPIDGLLFVRSPATRSAAHLLLQPSLCITLQGTKRSTIGNSHFTYGPGQALLVGVEMPAVSSITRATREKPFTGIILQLDLALMRDVLFELSVRPESTHEKAALVMPFQEPLEDCVRRLVQLLHHPNAVAVLRPLIMREIAYWLLTEPSGGMFARLLTSSTRSADLLKSIQTLRERYGETLRVEELADIAHMSTSVFHREFKVLTSMTPLQFQKQIRLLHARDLLLATGVNAETAAYRVGYESASHFSREYARMFGAPPHRDIAARRAIANR